MEKITIELNSQQKDFLISLLEQERKENRSAFSNVVSQMIIDMLYGEKEVDCEQGHMCTSDCGNTQDCPCESDHCCSMTSKGNLCGDTEECEFCASKVPDLAELANDSLNER